MGLLNLLNKKGAKNPDTRKALEEKEDDTPVSGSMSLVIVADVPQMPDDFQFKATMQMLFPTMESRPFNYVKDRASFTFRITDVDAAVGIVTKPIDGDKLSSACDLAWHWPDALEQVQFHTCHLMVGLNSEGKNPLKMSLLLSQVTAAVVHLTQGQAVLWPTGSVLQKGEDFLNAMRTASLEALPLTLWVSFNIFPEQDGTQTLVTYGMRSLGCPEVEVVSSQKSPEEVMNVAYGFAHFAATRGKHFEDGEALPDSSIIVRHGRSTLTGHGLVYRLEW